MSIGKILAEIQAWRSRPSRREQIQARHPAKEVPDTTPLSIPVGYETPPTMTELIQRYVRLEVSQQASADGDGTFQEEDDFSEDEHYPLPFTPFDVNALPMEADPDMPPAAPVEDPPSDDVEDVVDSPSASEGTDPKAASK